MCIHGEYGNRESLYNPVSEEKIAGSGLDYLALGHIHKASGLLKTGGTYVSWPGCPEGRGFDETGVKYVNIIDLEKGSCSLSQISISSRKYEILYVDVTDTDPVLAIHSSIPDETVKDVYRIILRGETDEFLDLNRIKRSLSDLFFEYRIKDETRLKRNIWESAGDDSLRGLFLSKMMKRYDSAKTESEKKAIESSVRWGLAAIDNAEEVCVHEN
jgi:DNA repair exonuclease SbcCD nuclease subunit